MTVAELREILADLPDEMSVVVTDGSEEFSSFGVQVVADESRERRGDVCVIDLTV